jgi:hypothetical protein
MVTPSPHNVVKPGVTEFEMMRGWKVANYRLVAANAREENKACRSLLLRALLRDSRQEGPDFGLPVPAVASKGSDGGQFPRLRPPRDRLRVDTEHGRNLSRCQQRLGFGRSCGHCPLLLW